MMRAMMTSDFSAHILVIEDDKDLQSLLKAQLERLDWQVSLASNGNEADTILAISTINLVILDLMLPGEDGLSICRRLRTNSTVPILILSARGDEFDRIIGLEMGADDYLPKPFNPRELEARVKAMLRRSRMLSRNPVLKATHLHIEGWDLDLRHRKLTWKNGVQIHLTPAEFELLRVFCERPGLTLSREQLLDLTQGHNNYSAERSIDILVSRLRKKLEREESYPKLFHTVRSGGYEFIGSVENRSEEAELDSDI